MTELDLPLTYEEADVVAGQRLRLRSSLRLKLLAALGLVALLILLAQRVSPTWLGGQPDPLLLIGMAAVFLLIPALTYLLGPFIDFRRKVFWRTPLALRLSDAGLRLALADAPADKGLELPWSELHHSLENEDVFILFFGSDQSFIVVPKRLFRTEAEMAFVRNLLATAGNSAGD